MVQLRDSVSQIVESVRRQREQEAVESTPEFQNQQSDIETEEDTVGDIEGPGGLGDDPEVQDPTREEGISGDESTPTEDVTRQEAEDIEPLPDRGPTQTQGIEQGASDIAEQAGQLESEVIAQNEGITDASQVRVERMGDQLVVETTPTGAQAMERFRQERAPFRTYVRETGERPTTTTDTLTRTPFRTFAYTTGERPTGGAGVDVSPVNIDAEQRNPRLGVQEEDTAQEVTDRISSFVSGVEDRFGVDFRDRNIGAVTPTDEETIQAAEAAIDPEVQESLTQGRGIFTDEQVAATLRRGRQRREFFGVAEEASDFVGGVTGSETAADLAYGVGRFPGELAAAPSYGAYALDIGTEAIPNLPRTIREEGAADTVQTILGTGQRIGASTVRDVKQDPVRAIGTIGAEVATGAIAGRALGIAGRAARQRVRTAGATEVDLGDITQESVVRNIETGGVEGERFPGAENPTLYETEPAEAVRQQAVGRTPDVIEQRFRERGIDGGVTLKKALDVEPEGPSRTRRVGGLETQEGSYESPGSFAGPELSPNFLRVGDRRARFSLRPGLPSLGGRPTGALIRTDVEGSTSTTLDEFNQELLSRSGETTARTKPAGEVSPGEIEAVIPPEARFADIGGSRRRNLLRRLGIGSDFYTEVSGQRVPLRPVAPEADVGGRSQRTLQDFIADERAQVGADAPGTTRTFTLDELSRRADGEAVDRPLPTFTPGGPSEDMGDTSEPRSPIDFAGVSSGAPITPTSEPMSPLSGSSVVALSTMGSGMPSDGEPTPSDPGTPSESGPSPTPTSGPTSSFLSEITGTTSKGESERFGPETEPQEPQGLGMRGGAAEAQFTSFVDPLTGETLSVN